VPFTLVRAVKYRTEDKLKLQTIHKHQQTNCNCTGWQLVPLTIQYDRRV